MLNRMLTIANSVANEEEIQEIQKIGFLYSVSRMSQLEVALRLWYLINHNLNGIYEKSFQNFMNETCRKEQ